MVYIGMCIPTTATLAYMHRLGIHRGVGTLAPVGDSLLAGAILHGIGAVIHPSGTATITTIIGVVSTDITDITTLADGITRSTAVIATQYTPTVTVVAHAVVLYPEQAVLHVHRRV